MDLSSKVVIPPQVMSRQVGGEIVILDLSSGSYYGLDPVGARIWQLMGEGMTLAQIRDTVLNEYEADADMIERDLITLVQELLELKLISI